MLACACQTLRPVDTGVLVRPRGQVLVPGFRHQLAVDEIVRVVVLPGDEPLRQQVRRDVVQEVTDGTADRARS